MTDQEKREYGIRAKQIRKHFKFSQKDFALELGYAGPSNIGHIEIGTNQFSEAARLILKEKYKVSLHWLDTGLGGMIVGSQPELQTINLKKQDLKIHEYGEKVLDWGNPFLTVLTVPVDTTGEQRVLVVPDYALASYTENYADKEYVSELPHETIPEDLKNRGTIAKFSIYGDSMEKNFYHGDQVYCSYVEIRNFQDFRFKIQNNYVYIVVAKGRAPMLKRLRYQDGDEYLQCYSDNEDQKTHSPFTIHLSEVKQLWYWRRKYSAHAPKPEVKHDEILDLRRGLHETNLRVDQVANEVKQIHTGIDDIKVLITGKKDITLQ